MGLRPKAAAGYPWLVTEPVFQQSGAQIYPFTGGTRVFKNSCATRNPRLY